MRAFLILLTVLTAVVPAAARPSRTIAVTIDDLPVVSTRSDLESRRTITKKLIRHISNAKIPAIGFVNENKLYAADKRDEAEIDLLRIWINAGLELGNHTFSHGSLHTVSLDKYLDDIVKGEAITKELLETRGRKIRYFRHPYLHTGLDMTVKAQLAEFLTGRGYTIAPVSFDNSDYIFARAYDIAFDRGDKKLMKKVGEAYVPYMESKMDYWERQSIKLFGRELSQTLLIHANSINADYLDDLARMLKKRGYKFVGLEAALKDDAYTLPDTFTRRGGISWLHRWALAKGREFVVPGEPAVPEFVMKLSGFESE